MSEQIKKRNEVEKAYKWHIEDLYENDKIWDLDVKKVYDMVCVLEGYQKRLCNSADMLLEFFGMSDQKDMLLEKVYVYANQKYHENTSDDRYQKMSDRASNLMMFANKQLSFVIPEILSAGNEKIQGFISENPELALYKRLLDEIFRDQQHVLPTEMEELLASSQEIADGPANTFSMFNNADIKFPTIKDENGDETVITHGRYSKLMESECRRVRKEAFYGLYSSYAKYKNTLASLFATNVKKNIFFSKARKYHSNLEQALNGSRIPKEVYTNLIEAVHENLPSMYQYMKIRKRALGVKELHMYDIYAPVTQDYKMKVPFEDAKKMVLEGLKPLGQEYQDILQEGFNGGWIDIYENEGKRSGAYSWGAYGTHPFVLLNYQESLNHVFTLAHEMGHAIHSYYSDKTQPYPYAGYRIFVAEVASTCNEALLMSHMIKNASDKKQKAYLINYHLEQFRATLYRQTMFAEFEMKVHEMAERGESLTVDVLCDLYYDLNKLYFGDHVVIDKEISMEWARIPHFYSSFYVYQYATGYSAAIALSRKILKEGEKAVYDYIHNFLCGGSSEDPIDLLKSAGVDMSTKKPVQEALKVFEELSEQLDELI